MVRQQDSLTSENVVNFSLAAALEVRAGADTARFSLRVDPAQLSAASNAFGVELPRRIGGLSGCGERLAICLAPNEWFLTAPLHEQDVIESDFSALYATLPHSLVDIGHREVSIEVEGPKAVLILQSAIPLDIEAMPVATGCRTIFDRTQIVLVRKAEEHFRIELLRSFLEHVCGLLQAASREIALDI